MTDTALFLGGLFNITDPFLHLQIYIWGWLIISVFATFAHIGWYYAGWKPYAPLHGLYWSYKNGSNAALIFDQNLIGEMISERDAKCIFDYGSYDYRLTTYGGRIGGLINWFKKKTFYYPTVYLDNISPLHALVYKFGHVNKDVEIARHLQNGEWERSPSMVCGGVPVDVIVDADNWTIRNSIQHKAIERSADMWNETHPEDQVHSYSKYLKYLMNGNITKPDEITMVLNVPWVRVDSAFPLGLEENEYAGKRRQMAEQEYNADEAFKNKLALYVLIAGVGLAIGILIVRLITHFA